MRVRRGLELSVDDSVGEAKHRGHCCPGRAWGDGGRGFPTRHARGDGRVGGTAGQEWERPSFIEAADTALRDPVLG